MLMSPFHHCAQHPTSHIAPRATAAAVRTTASTNASAGDLTTPASIPAEMVAPESENSSCAPLANRRVPALTEVRLFVSQGHHRIDGHCTTRGNIRCGKCDEQQQDGDGRESLEIGSAHRIEQARHQPSQPECN